MLWFLLKFKLVKFTDYIKFHSNLKELESLVSFYFFLQKYNEYGSIHIHSRDLLVELFSFQCTIRS